jgi:hypothetical protein
MAVTVYFVGVMLFVLDRPDVEVWLPDAQIGTDPPEGRRPTPGSHGEHCDSTAARAHWPGVFVTDQNGTEIKRFTPPLGQVRISGGPGKTTGAGTLAEVAALDKINNNGSQEDLRLIPASTPNRVAAHVTIRGGTIGPEVNSDLSWDIGFQHNPSHGQAGQFVRIVSWTSDTDEATSRIPSRTGWKSTSTTSMVRILRATNSARATHAGPAVSFSTWTSSGSTSS